MIEIEMTPEMAEWMYELLNPFFIPIEDTGVN